MRASLSPEEMAELASVLDFTNDSDLHGAAPAQADGSIYTTHSIALPLAVARWPVGLRRVPVCPSGPVVRSDPVVARAELERKRETRSDEISRRTY